MFLARGKVHGHPNAPVWVWTDVHLVAIGERVGGTKSLGVVFFGRNGQEKAEEQKLNIFLRKTGKKGCACGRGLSCLFWGWKKTAKCKYFHGRGLTNQHTIV